MTAVSSHLSSILCYGPRRTTGSVFLATIATRNIALAWAAELACCLRLPLGQARPCCLCWTRLLSCRHPVQRLPGRHPAQRRLTQTQSRRSKVLPPRRRPRRRPVARRAPAPDGGRVFLRLTPAFSVMNTQSRVHGIMRRTACLQCVRVYVLRSPATAAMEVSCAQATEEREVKIPSRA